MDLDFFHTQRRRPGLIGVEKIMLCYMAITTLVILITWNLLADPVRLLAGRGAVLVGMAVVIAIYHKAPSRATIFLRVLYQMGLLAYWYPDTYELNRIFPNLDYFFAALEETLFGGQPSLDFAAAFSSKAWSEAFNLGYFSYYPMIIGLTLFTLFGCYRRFEKSTFIIVCSFFLYYIIYVFLPVTGPQYYFQAIGETALHAHVYPNIGDYFFNHHELLPTTGAEGFFRDLVEATQQSGERPTAAFPSSHVGISTILMMLAWRTRHSLFFILMPFYVLLCFATVYVQAHYAIDAIAGFVTAPLFYKISHKLYYTSFFHRPHGYRDF